MASNSARRFEPTGNVTAMKADSEFLGAEDIMGRGPVRIRVLGVLTYPKGYQVGGKPAKGAFPVLDYERRTDDGRWVHGKKRWIISSKEVRQALIVRARSCHAADWRGMELDLHAEVCRSPKGGLTWGVRVKPTREEGKDDYLRDAMAEAAARLPPDKRQAEPVAEPEIEQRHYDEPPEDWQGSVHHEIDDSTTPT